MNHNCMVPIRIGRFAHHFASSMRILLESPDRPPRMLHIVPYESFDARLALRKELYIKGLWPPKNAPEQIIRATSLIALPTLISTLS